MRRIITCCSLLAAVVIFGAFQLADASGPICFNYGKTRDLNRLCIVTKIDGHRMCLVDFDVPSHTRGQHEICEFIRDHGNAKVGDRIIVDAAEWKGYPDKCYKSPGCGKAVVVGGGPSKQVDGGSSLSKTGGSQVTAATSGMRQGTARITYTTVEDICADGKRAIGKVAEISDLFLKDCFPEAINFNRSKNWCNNRISLIILKPSQALADRLKPFEFQHDLTVRFKVTKIQESNMFIEGEYIGIEKRGASVPSSTPAEVTAGQPETQREAAAAPLPASPPQSSVFSGMSEQTHQPSVSVPTIEDTLNILKKTRDLFR